ncbi:MAG: EamA family transporter, partial [Terracidiphilus sp.]
MSSSGAAAGLGLLSAASWGGSDFAGGWGARRASSLLVTASGQIVSLAALLIVCLALRVALPGTSYLIYGAIGGFEGAIALAVFYRALAMGVMGLTAALTGVMTALVAVAFDIVNSGWPNAITFAGLAIGVVAIWLISQSPKSEGADTSRSALLLGAGAGVGFGAQLILFKAAAAGGVLWALTSGRVAGVGAILLVIAIAPPVGPWR